LHKELSDIKNLIDKYQKSIVPLHYGTNSEVKLQKKLFAEEFQNTFAFRSMYTGQSEVERRWNLQNDLYPSLNGSLSFITGENCSNLIDQQNQLYNWECFKLGAARKMREIAINAPHNENTLIYCDETMSGGLILLEINKDTLYPWVVKRLPEHIVKSLFFVEQRMFNTHFKLINETILKLPIGSLIDRNEFKRFIFIPAE
jgi:hypothetical protein